VTNSPKAGVLDLAKTHGIPTHVTNRQEFYSEHSIKPQLQQHQVDFIALAGFLWLLPEVLLHAYPAKIVNIHPALLPKYGGKGMYGHHVHQAVKAAGERESGITIHYVDEQYDNGAPIFQARVALEADDDAETIGRKVLALEHRHYPEQLVQLLRKNLQP
jgi:phosphoribosylglycinamide formyltransferase-1